MYYVFSIVLLLGGCVAAWKPQIWLDLTQCRSGCRGCSDCSEWALMRTRVGAIFTAVLGAACLISLLINGM